MKFARYLQDTQTPEWKKAYIDYRGLKKRINVIRGELDEDGRAENEAENVEIPIPTSSKDFPDTPKDWSSASPQKGNEDAMPGVGHTERSHVSGDQHVGEQSAPSTRMSFVRRRSSRRPSSVTRRTSSAQFSTTPTSRRSIPRDPSLRTPGSGVVNTRSKRQLVLPLHELIPLLPPAHKAFFAVLDAELDKVDVFYADQEKVMMERGRQLSKQLRELYSHRQIFQETHPIHGSRWMNHARLFLAAGISALVGSRSDHDDSVPTAIEMQTQPSHLHRKQSIESNTGTRHDESASVDVGAAVYDSAKVIENAHAQNTNQFHENDDHIGTVNLHDMTRNHELDPEEYRHARRKLRKAVVEYYRGLEALNNYRILNIAGFRKSLKKYEKVSKVAAQQSYMSEKVQSSSFASGTQIDDMSRKMEEFYAISFERGDRKKALSHLRGSQIKSHHFSTFRSGVWLGLSLPPTVYGLVVSFSHNTRTALPSWNIILYIYSIFFIPTIFSLLIGINLLVWSRQRINYAFIFELDMRTRLDYREYFELPSILLCALAYAFFLSFAQIGPPLVWPLVWLLFMILMMLNPFMGIARGPSRWWLLKNTVKLAGSGIWTVEFTDFWLGDQFCSLVYTLSNIFFIGCFYTRYFPALSSSSTSNLNILTTLSPNSTIQCPVLASTSSASIGDLLSTSSAYDLAVQDAWTTCGTADNWGYHVVLSVLPFAARFIQSMKRYADSRLDTHLINGGKYAMGIVYYFFYYYWRHKGDEDNGASFALWCLTGTIYASYACSWDFLMDWSIIKPHARHPLLRNELIYSADIPMYYVAMITNILIRFIWVLYIPSSGLSLTVRTFIGGSLEMLRRWQWNFYRLENEHLGNMDQYRATREVPLPYSIDDTGHSDEDDDDHSTRSSGSSWLRRRFGRELREPSLQET